MICAGEARRGAGREWTRRFCDNSQQIGHDLVDHGLDTRGREEGESILASAVP